MGAGPGARGGGRPSSPDRRRLLLALGFGAVNAGVLSQLAADAVGEVTAGGSGSAGGGTGGGNGNGGGSGADVEPPALADAAAEPAAGHTFDTVIANGRVVDPESGFDRVAHVGIDGDRITAVSLTELTGRATVDATDKVVAPGFIDILSYEPNGYGEWFKIADGVTTNLGMHGLDFDAATFFERFANEGSPVHYGGAYDAPFRRFSVLGLDPGDEATPDQIAQLVEDARQQVAAGWIGIDLEPEYTFGVTYDELRGLAQVGADAGVPVFVHGRYSDDQAPGTNAETLAEILQLARDTGCGVHVEHLISTGGTFTMDESIATLTAAIAEGLDVTACMYPYDFWATYLGSARFADGWQERFHISYGDLVVAGTGERLTEATFPARQADNLLVAAYGIPEADVRTCLGAPFVMIGSDAILEPSNNNHPRSTGCFARTLGRYVRDEEILDLPTALAKMTILPARRLESAAPALRRKGRLQRGADADVVVFDPATVGDRSTVQDPAQESVGIEWVLVAGVPMKSPAGIDRDQRPGRPITSTST